MLPYSKLNVHGIRGCESCEYLKLDGRIEAKSLSMHQKDSKASGKRAKNSLRGRSECRDCPLVPIFEIGMINIWLIMVGFA